jgi:hypothetical protein
MKLEEILKKPYVEKLIHSSLCRSYPQLVFEELQGKKERFRATYNSENKSIKFSGALHNRVEVDELMEFLSTRAMRVLGDDEEVMELCADSVCLCGADDWELVGRTDRFDGPLCGRSYLVFKCNACGKQARLIHGWR